MNKKLLVTRIVLNGLLVQQLELSAEYSVSAEEVADWIYTLQTNINPMTRQANIAIIDAIEGDDHDDSIGDIGWKD